MASLMLVNPRKRRTTRKRRTVAKRKTPSRRLATTVTRKTYRRNPIRKANIVDTFTGGAVGAGGALAVDVIMSKLPVPANLKTGLAAPVVKGLVGIGLGMAVAKFGKSKKLGTQLADGAVTVALYNTGRGMIGPKLGLSDDLLGDDLLYYSDDGMSYYDDNSTSDMGWTSPANTYDDFDDDM